MSATDDDDSFATRPLVEGVDYYVEADRWVFTEAHHRRRGYCCESGCRHCPYGFVRETGNGRPPQDKR